MCFSAEASFTASIALAAISFASYQRITKSKQLPLLGLPIGFALQQFLEGLVWLSFKYSFNPILSQLVTYGFLFFAFIFWPTYIPLVLTKLERKIKSRKFLTGLTVLGSIVSASFLVILIAGGATAEMANCYVLYRLGVIFSYAQLLVIGLIYLLVTVGAMLSSSLRGMRVLGIATLSSFIIAQYFYYLTAVSVWCFFAALLSLLIYWIIGLNRA